MIVFLMGASALFLTIITGRAIKEPLFGGEEDLTYEAKVLGNIVLDIMDDTFHYDYLLAAITSLLWVRVVLLLSLTEFFGPTLVMIWRMAKVISKFLLLFLLMLVTYGAIATLTIGYLDEFKDLYWAIRTYFDGILGNFDFTIYDEMIPSKRYYAIGLNVLVLLSGTILMINLLIAIMTEQYTNMNSVKTGLYWSLIIAEMPKYAYHKYYGSLSMFPFFMSWLSFLSMPFLVFLKDRDTLIKINKVCFFIAYMPVAIWLLV